MQIFRLTGRRTILSLVVLAAAAVVPSASAQKSKLAAAAPVTYDNRYELYVGLNFANGQAGQNLPSRFNMGGGEVLGTYWLNRRVGIGADFREQLGTTPVFPNQYFNGRALVQETLGMLGAQVRGPRNQYVALGAHAYAGVVAGSFNQSDATGTSAAAYGLYTDRVKPTAVAGVSLDFNRSKHFAIRLQPDITFEHLGSETREYFSISGGVVYRFHKTIR